MIKLYKEGKTYKEISKIVRISPRDIGKIINEYTGEKTIIHTKSNTAKGYSLLLKGRSPIQVAIKLDLKFEDAKKIHLEDLNLQRMRSVEIICRNYTNYIPQILQLIDKIKIGQISSDEFNKFCQFIEDIPTLERRKNELLHRNNILSIKNASELVE